MFQRYKDPKTGKLMEPHNTDGIDPGSGSSDIWIHHVHISNGDDSVAIKPSTPCTRNILVEDSTFEHVSKGVVRIVGYSLRTAQQSPFGCGLFAATVHHPRPVLVARGFCQPACFCPPAACQCPQLLGQLLANISLPCLTQLLLVLVLLLVCGVVVCVCVCVFW